MGELKIRDRVKAFKRVKASTLLPHPKNWRRHPEGQTAALRGILDEVGFADALLVRETPKGLQLIDGHLRSAVAGDQKVPVLVLDVTEKEADKLLGTHDPLAAMAEADEEKFKELMAELDIESESLQAMFDEMMAQLEEEIGDETADEIGDEGEPAAKKKTKKGKEVELEEMFQVVVILPNELEQKKLFDRLVKEGYSCRVLTL